MPQILETGMFNLKILLLLLSISVFCSGLYGKTSEFIIAENGNSNAPIIVSPNASTKVNHLAEQLSSYLTKITSAKFQLETGYAQKGIVVGTIEDFDKYKTELKIIEIPDREAYIIKTHNRGIHIVGATEIALQHAIWDFLYRIGYRQYFPGQNWEIIPKVPVLKVSLDIHEKPNYWTRNIWYGWGTWGYNDEPYENWIQKNRIVSAFKLNTGHIYEQLIDDNREKFIENPEYYGLVEGKRKSSKICIGNPKLRELVVDYALEYFRKDPSRDSISMDPSDGPGAGVSYEMGWCECELCESIGSISDRAIYLANTVAEAVNAKYENKYVGIYAYNMHSPPPKIRVHPNVIVSVATSFIQGGFTLQELLDGWSSKGTILGIREYFSVNTWDRDLPGKSRGSNIDYIVKNIPYFYSEGARCFTSESSDNWGCNGLGYYVASRILWDIDDATDVEYLIDDFLTRSFGYAKEPMANFYSLIDGSNSPLMSEDLIGRMYRYLNEARNLADKKEILNRINDLVLYTRYVELYRIYSGAQGQSRQKAFENLIKYAYRIRKSMMVHTKALYRDLENRDKSVLIPQGAKWNVPEEKNPWKNSRDFTDSELLSFIDQGIKNNDVLEYKAVDFSMNLVSAKPLDLPEVPLGDTGTYGRNLQRYYTINTSDDNLLKLKVTGGLIEKYRNSGNVKLDLYHLRGVFQAHESHKEVPADSKEHSIQFNLNDETNLLYKLEISDGRNATSVSWPQGTPMTVISTHEDPADFLKGKWNLYFYVPKGTKEIVFYADGSGVVLDDNQNEVFEIPSGKPGYFKLNVGKGQDGSLWQFSEVTGKIIVLNVPPCLARNGQELILPKEVIDRDLTTEMKK